MTQVFEEGEGEGDWFYLSRIPALSEVYDFDLGEFLAVNAPCT